MIKKFIPLLILIFFIFSAYSKALGSVALKAGITLPKDSQVLQKSSLDVTGDGKNDNITLYGQKIEENSQYMKNIFLIVNNLKIDFPKDTTGGYDAKFILKDFTGDRVPDIFVTAGTGGSGGIVYCHVFTLKGGKPKLIFSPAVNNGITINGTFQDGYKVNLTINQTKKVYNFDFSDRKSMYDDPNLGLYKGGKLQKKVEIMIDYFSLITPVDQDRDGIFEIQGIQQAWGIAHVDRLVEIKSIWKWEKNSWALLNTDVKQLK